MELDLDTFVLLRSCCLFLRSEIGRACEVAWPARVGRRGAPAFASKSMMFCDLFAEAIEVDNARRLGGLASNADCVIDYTGAQAGSAFAFP